MVMATVMTMMCDGSGNGDDDNICVDDVGGCKGCDFDNACADHDGGCNGDDVDVCDGCGNGNGDGFPLP